MKASGRCIKELAKRLGLAGVALIFAFGAVELSLRLAKFSAPLQPILIVDREGLAHPDDTRGLIPDPELQVRFNPGADWRGRRVNQLGFLGREVEPKKTPGSVRVICMGDSCTASGIPTYSDLLHDLLTNAPPAAQAWEAFNMAVHGYSTEHGLRLFRRQTRDLAPDYVTLFYGWNDHWRAHTTDRLRLARIVGPIQGRMLKRLRRLRIYQLVTSRSMVRQIPDADNFVLRVPHAEYRQNLRSLVAGIRKIGAVPILLTAPRASRLTPLLVSNRQVARLEDAARLHDEYIEITRAVARDTDTPLLDLARIFDEADAVLFSDDGIHHVRAGRELIAEEIYRMLVELADLEDRSEAAVRSR